MKYRERKEELKKKEERRLVEVEKEREIERKEQEERRERRARGEFTPEKTPPPSPKMIERIDGKLTEEASPYEETDGEMETDPVGAMGLKTTGGCLEISRENIEAIDSYAASIGKDASNMNECFSMFATLIKQSERPKDGPHPH